MACSQTFSIALKLEVQGYEVRRSELVGFTRQWLQIVGMPEKQARNLIDAYQGYDDKYKFGRGLFRL
jgi:hypothetical protein